MKDKLRGIQIKGKLLKRIGNIYYFKKVEEITIDTEDITRLLFEKDLIKLVTVVF